MGACYQGVWHGRGGSAPIGKSCGGRKIVPGAYDCSIISLSSSISTTSCLPVGQGEGCKLRWNGKIQSLPALFPACFTHPVYFKQVCAEEGDGSKDTGKELGTGVDFEPLHSALPCPLDSFPKPLGGQGGSSVAFFLQWCCRKRHSASLFPFALSERAEDQ